MLGFIIKKATTYSPTDAVPSALTGLTSLFGMGRGEPRCYSHLKSLSVIGFSNHRTNILTYYNNKELYRYKKLNG